MQNYTRSELEKSSKLIGRVSAQGLKEHEQIKVIQEYDNLVRDCTKRGRDHLFVARRALNAVIDAENEHLTIKQRTCFSILQVVSYD